MTFSKCARRGGHDWCDPCDGCEHAANGDWIEKAAEDIVKPWECPHGFDAVGFCTECLVFMMRKHRDGK